MCTWGNAIFLTAENMDNNAASWVYSLHDLALYPLH